MVLIDNGVEISRQKKPHVIIGIGGGSTIDTAKAISGLTTNPGSVIDYLEGVGKGLHIQKPSVPYIAIPTTAGTGAEVTKNAVISSRNLKFKKSIRSPWLIPDIALLDPELTLDLPKNITAETSVVGFALQSLKCSCWLDDILKSQEIVQFAKRTHRQNFL